MARLKTKKKPKTSQAVIDVKATPKKSSGSIKLPRRYPLFGLLKTEEAIATTKIKKDVPLHITNKKKTLKKLLPVRVQQSVDSSLSELGLQFSELTEAKLSETFRTKLAESTTLKRTSQIAAAFLNLNKYIRAKNYRIPAQNESLPLSDNDEICPTCNGRGYEKIEIVIKEICKKCTQVKLHNIVVVPTGMKKTACPKCHGIGKKKVTRCAQKTGPVQGFITKGTFLQIRYLNPLQWETCRICKGVGFIIEKCPFCKGKTYVYLKRKIIKLCTTCKGAGTRPFDITLRKIEPGYSMLPELFSIENNI